MTQEMSLLYFPSGKSKDSLLAIGRFQEITAMNKKQATPEASQLWSPPKRPFEIEAIVFLFLLVALVLPFYLGMIHTEPEAAPVTLIEQARGTAPQAGTNYTNVIGMLWGVSILGLYLMHITIGSSSITFNTTPAYFLVAPILFGGLAYYRMYQQQGIYDLSSPLVSTSPGAILLAFGAILAATCLLARMRMLRYRLRFTSVDWDMILTARRDATFFTKLAGQLRPLLYPPRRYFLSAQGMLIEGWLFIRAVPISIIEDVERVEQFNSLQQAEIYAGSAKDLVQLNLTEQVQPILVSPSDTEKVLKYLRERLGERLKVRRSKNLDTTRIRTRDLARTKSRTGRIS